MQNAYLIAAIIAVPTALLSCFLVMKGWALMGDAVSHAILPGLVLAWWLGLPVLIGAFAAGMVCAVLTGYLAENSRIKPDTIMGVVFSGMFGLGIVLFVAMETSLDLHHILFGNMLGVGSDDLTMSGGISLVLVAGLAMKWKDLLAYCFDPVQARAQGLPITLLHYGLLTGLSLAIVSTLSAVGVILAIGLLITPGAIAFLLCRRFGLMLIVAVLVSEIAMVSGITLSFWLDSAPAPTIMLVMTVVFIAAFIYRQACHRMAALQQPVATSQHSS
ncbi:MAG: metal ABC transporter permease [Candidatus Puniceispirillales bacterium]